MFLLGLILWAVVIAGALPRHIHDVIETNVPWWHPVLLCKASSILEFFFGFSLFATQLHLGAADTGVSTSWPAAAAGMTMLLEGIVRLVIASRTDDPVAAIPLAVLFRAAEAVSRAKSRVG